MIDPVYVVGVGLKHAQLWSSSHIKAWERMPIYVYPENIGFIFRGVRDRVILILESAHIPNSVLNLIADRNTIIDLNSR